MIRAYFATLFTLLLLLVLIAQAIKLIWPPEAPLMIDGANAYATLYIAKPKPPAVVRPAPPRPVPPPPRYHRLKTNMEPFNRFEFDQRTMV